LAVALWTTGCAESVERVPWLDLAAALPVAETRPAGRGASEQARSSGVRAVDEALFLPLGSEVDFFLQPPAGSSLRVESLRHRGTEEGWVEVSVLVEGGGEKENAGPSERALGRLEGESGGELELPSDGDRPLRLRLQALPADGASLGDEPGVLLLRPILAAPRTAPPDAAEPRSAETIPSPAEPRRLNVLIYLIDTLRADHLGCYGYQRPVSPAIDAFARDATLFENAVAQSSWTRPSVASLFTGVWPGTHGVHGRRDTLAPEALTLPELFHRHGYRTAGLVTNRNVARAFGFGQGFELYRMLRLEDSSADVYEQAVEWLTHWQQERDGEQPENESGSESRAPFFLYLHTVDPHASYDPPETFRQRFAPDIPRDGTGMRWWMRQLKAGQIEVSDKRTRQLLDLYDAEIAANDESFGRLIDWLTGAGLLEETVIVLLSDHGEEFHEHGRWEHGKSLHTELLDVPLVVRFPGTEAAALRGLRVSRPAQQIDVLPTLLTYLGLPVPPGMEGRNLLGPIDDDARIYSHLELDSLEAASVTAGRWRLIEGRSTSHGLGLELYDRWVDPIEHDDLAARRPVTAGYLRSQLLAHELLGEGALRPGEAVLDDETREQLRALGYLD